MIQKVGQIGVAVKDLNRALVFYHDSVGNAHLYR